MTIKNSEKTRFKPGKSGNPKGRPKTPEPLKGVDEFPPSHLKLAISKYFSMSYSDLSRLSDEIGKNKSQLSSIEALIVRALRKAIVTGDYNKAVFLIDRLCGKISDKIDMNFQEVSHSKIIDYINS